MQKRGKGISKSNNASGLLRLTKISATPIQKRSMRYDVSGSGAFIMTTSFMKTLTLFGVTASTSSYTLLESIKLNAVSLTILPASSTNMGTLAFRWLGPRTATEVETLVYAPAIPSKFTFTPPAESLASFWISQVDTTFDSTSLFEFDPSDDTVHIIMDLHFSIIYDTTGSSNTVTVSAPSTTGVYWRRLVSSSMIAEPIGTNVII